uniref:ATP synthase F0 subunit 8 n=1 Tax=Conostigmus sp. MM-2013 TaxID=1357450 RepID=V9NK65_9HYME|nr:ATP synthase F0 subunit 8 [Conostigmus sp. MM-2013]
MSPMWWSMNFMFSMLMIMLMLILIHYLFMFNKNEIKTNKIYLNYKNYMNWKW